MAKKAEKSVKDAEAIDAVEEALSIEFSEEDLSAEDIQALEDKLSDVTNELTTEAAESDIEETLPSERLEAAAESPAEDIDFLDAPPAPANDAHEAEIAGLVYNLRQQPKSRIFFWTTLFSIAWLAAVAAYGYFNVLPEFDSPLSTGSLLNDTKFLTLVAIAFLPLLPLWSFSYLMRRAQEMRHAARSMMEAALRLLQPEKIATGSVATVGTAIRREVAAIGDGVEQAIARAGELEFMVQKEVMSLERSYGDSEMRLKRLVEDITNEREEVVSHAEKLRGSIQDSQTTFSEEIQTASTRIEDQIRSLTDLLNNSLSERGHSITTELTDRSNELITLLEETGKQVEEKLGAGKEQISTEVTKRAKEISEVIGLSGQAVANLMDTRFAQINSADREITDKLDEGRQAFEQNISARKQELEEVLAATNQSVSNLLKSNSAEIVEQSNQTITRLEESRQALRQEVEAHVADIQSTATIAANTVSDAAESGAGFFESRSEKIISSLEDSLSIRTNEFETRIAETGDKIDSLLAEKISGIDSTLSTSGSNLVSALGMRTEALGKVLQERTNVIGETISDRLTGFGEQMTGHVDSAVTKLTEQTETLKSATKSVEDVIREGNINFEVVAEKSSKLAKESSEKIAIDLKKAEEEISGSITRGAKEFSDSVIEKQQQLQEVVEGNAKMLSDTIDQKNSELGTTIEAKTQRLIDELGEKTTNMASKLNQGAHRIGSELETKSRDAMDRMDRNVRELHEHLEKGTHDITAQFTAGNEVLNSRLLEGKENLLQSIAQSVSDAGNAIDDKAGKITALLDDRAKIINDTLGSSLVETQRNLETKSEEFSTLFKSQTQDLIEIIETQAKPGIEQKTAEFNEMLKSRTSELRKLIDDDAKPIVEHLETSGQAIKDRLTGISDALTQQTETIFSSMGSSTEQLQQLIVDSNRSMIAMQGELAQQTQDFSSAVNASFEGIERSHQMATDVEQKLYGLSSSLSENIAGVSERLSQQSNVLQDATRLIDNAQNNLQETVETKQTVLEQLARGLATHTDEMNASMQSFGQTISGLVEDVTVRSRDVGGSVASEISTAIDDATSRFNDAVDAMRSAAGSIRDELEETRAQMRRGVLELPDETVQSASAMRRVVTDQIAALRDLSAIVERSGKMFDSSQPMQQAASTSAPAPVANTATPQRQEPVSFPPNTTVPAPAAQQATAAPRPQPSPQPVPARAGQETGWVSDLLRRASRDEQAKAPMQAQPDNRAPHHVVDSLNSLSMDIANAIDHETSVDLWERYQRGETNVFTRRLYTLQGQKTFDEIRSKYASESEFRGAVDRYIDDFERLLQDSSRNDPSGAMAQNYLNSDTGKVYTMLAHASGRLGS